MYNLTIAITEDNTEPLIELTEPTNNEFLSNDTVLFLYTAQDFSDLANCSIYIDGIYNQSNWTGIVNGGNNNFTLNISEGTHNWTIYCTDDSTNNNIGNSSTWNFTVDITSPPAFEQLAPVDRTISSDLNPIFSWQQTSDTNIHSPH